MTKNDILDKANTIINGERQGAYGQAEDSFSIIAKMWSAYLGKAVDASDVANMMVLMKVARNANGVYKDDNWIDICGYAALGGEIQSKDSEEKDTSFDGYNLTVINADDPENCKAAFDAILNNPKASIVGYRSGFALKVNN